MNCCYRPLDGAPGSPGSPVSWLSWLLAPLAPGSPGSWQDYRSWYKTRRFMTFNRGNSSGWRIGYGPCSSLICRNGWCRTYWCFSLELYLLPHLTRHHHNSTQKSIGFKSFWVIAHVQAEFLVTPKFGVLLRIRSNWAKHSEFTPKFGAPRLGHHFCSLNGWKILSRSWDMTKSRCLQKTLSARTNFLQIVVQNYRWQK